MFGPRPSVGEIVGGGDLHVPENGALTRRRPHRCARVRVSAYVPCRRRERLPRTSPAGGEGSARGNGAPRSDDELPASTRCHWGGLPLTGTLVSLQTAERSCSPW